MLTPEINNKVFKKLYGEQSPPLSFQAVASAVEVVRNGETARDCEDLAEYSPALAGLLLCSQRNYDMYAHDYLDGALFVYHALVVEEGYEGSGLPEVTCERAKFSSTTLSELHEQGQNPLKILADREPILMAGAHELLERRHPQQGLAFRCGMLDIYAAIRTIVDEDSVQKLIGSRSLQLVISNE